MSTSPFAISFTKESLTCFPSLTYENIVFEIKNGKIIKASANDDEKIMALLKELWATGDTQKVTDGVLGAEFIWQEDLNKVAGLNAMVKMFLDLIQDKGMLEAVKTIL